MEWGGGIESDAGEGQGETERLETALEMAEVQVMLGELYREAAEYEHTWNQEEEHMYQTLIHHPSCIVTPHVAGWTVESKRNIATTMIRKITRQL